MSPPEMRTPELQPRRPDQSPTSSASIIADLDGDRKGLASLKTQAAMAGCGLHELSGGGYLLTRWQLARELPDLRAVSMLLARMRGRA